MTLAAYGLNYPQAKVRVPPRVVRTGSYDEDHYYILSNGLEILVQEEGEYIEITDRKNNQLFYGKLEGYIQAKTIGDKVVFGYIARKPGEHYKLENQPGERKAKLVTINEGQPDMDFKILLIRDKKYVNKEESLWQPVGAQVRLIPA